MPSGKSFGGPTFTVVGASYETFGTRERSEATAWAPRAVIPAPRPSFRTNSRRSFLSAVSFIRIYSTRRGRKALGDGESLHRHRVRRTANRAEAAADAAVVVLDHRRKGETVSRGHFGEDV